MTLSAASSASPPPADRIRTRAARVALAGNPNTGKTTLFNALTGFHSRVGNYPGVTVDRKTGTLRAHDPAVNIEIVDLPGAYSLSACSADEAIALDVLIGSGEGENAPEAVVCVVDAAHLHRNLFLVSQILDLRLPVVIALNMVDLAEAGGVRVRADLLGQRLGVPVVPVVATKGRGIIELTKTIAAAVARRSPPASTALPPDVDREIQAILPLLPEHGLGSASARRARLVQALLNPGGAHEERILRLGVAGLGEALKRSRARLAGGGALAEIEAKFRYAWIDSILAGAVDRTAVARRRRSDAADKVLTHPVAGLAVFLALMALVFQSIYTWSGPLMEWIGDGFTALGNGIAPLLPAGAVRSLVSNGLVAGVGSVLVFLPQILILFLFLAILEDCGYMGRAAMLAHRFMSRLGLGGKSFIPLLSSFACAIPGIMATRTIDHPRDRLITVLIAPLMSCSARLPVYVLMIGAFVPAVPLLGGIFNLQGVVLVAMYLVGVVTAIPVAVLLRKTILKGQTPPFLIELPSYKWPSARTVLHRMVEQGREFVLQAGTIILAVTVVIWALGYYPRPAAIAAEHDARREAARVELASGSMGPQMGGMGPRTRGPVEEGTSDALAAALETIDREEAGAYLRQSFLGRMGRWIEPVVAPLGWDWRIGTAAIASFPAREVVIATMGTIYNLGEGEDESSSTLRETLMAAQWPDGRRVFNLPVALSIMVFFALCCQCGGTLAAIKRETKSWRWPLVTFAYMTGLAYVAALVTYQVAVRLV